MILLTAKLVETVIREECAKVRCSFTDVLNRGQAPNVVAARITAIKRLLRETNCQKRELAEVWGCPESTIYSAIKSPPPVAYDGLTAERLRWAHGEERAAQIIAGSDWWTKHDTAAWRRLCARAAP